MLGLKILVQKQGVVKILRKSCASPENNDNSAESNFTKLTNLSVITVISFVNLNIVISFKEVSETKLKLKASSLKALSSA